MADRFVIKITVFSQMFGEIRRPRPHDRSCLRTLSLWGSQCDNCGNAMGIDPVTDRSRRQIRGEENPVVRILLLIRFGASLEKTDAKAGKAWNDLEDADLRTLLYR